MTKISMTETQENIFVLNFEHLNFDIVSYFVLRISDFLTIANNFLVFLYGFSCIRHDHVPADQRFTALQPPHPFISLSFPDSQRIMFPMTFFQVAHS